MRIDKFLSHLKYGSRSDIKDQIGQGRILKNGLVVRDPGEDVLPDSDLVDVGGERVFYRQWIYLMLNKPQGVLSANRDDRQKTVIDLVPSPYDRFDLDLCGRLDLDTEGLILLTNDGDLLHQIISPKKDIEKHYEATLAHPLGDYSALEKGVRILDGKDLPYVTKPAKVVPLSDTRCQIRLTEGKFHEVKRMFEAIGNEVVHLKRVAIGGLRLDPDLPSGACKELTFSEVQAVFR